MPGSVFATNVLVHIVSGDPVKADRAEAIVGDGGVISVQVLNELTNVARRKMRMTWPETRAFLSTLRGLLAVQAITIETHNTGLAFAERYNLYHLRRDDRGLGRPRRLRHPVVGGHANTVYYRRNSATGYLASRTINASIAGKPTTPGSIQ